MADTPRSHSAAPPVTSDIDPATPAGTTPRFLALIAVALASTLFVYASIAAVWPADAPRREAVCEVRSGLYLMAGHQLDSAGSSAARTYLNCMAPIRWPRAGWIAGGLLALAVIAALLYRLFPWWRIRRSRLRRLDHCPELWSRLREPLAALVGRAGLHDPPVFLLDPTSRRAGGLAFGSRRRPLVCLDAGLVALADRDRAAFDAIVLHELAHHRRNDVVLTYASIAVWRAFLLVALVPYLIAALDSWVLSARPWSIVTVPDPMQWHNVGSGLPFVRAVLLVAAVFLVRTFVLRARECHADAAVAAWTGRPDPYREIVNPMVPRRQRWRRWSTHPSWAARHRMLRHPARLGQPRPGEYVVVGLVVEWGWTNLVAALDNLGWYRAGNGSIPAAGLGWALVVAVFVWIIAQQAAGHRRRAGATPRGAGPAGLALGIGLAVGGRLQLRGDHEMLVTLLTPVALGQVALLGAGCALGCAWAARCAALVPYGRWLRGRRALAALGVFAVALGILTRLHLYADRAVAVRWPTLLGSVLTAVSDLSGSAGAPPATTPVVQAIVAAFVLPGPRWAIGVGTTALWVIPLLLARNPGRLLRVALGAAAAGTAGWAAAVTAGWRLSPFDLHGPAGALWVAAGDLAVAVLAQVVVAIVVARRSGLVVAATAGWLTGVGCGLGLWAEHYRNGAVDSVLATRPLQLLLVTGALAAVLGAMARRWARPRRSVTARSCRRWPVTAQPDPPQPGPPRRCRSTVRAGVGTATLVAVGAAALLYWPSAPKAAAVIPPRPVTGRLDPTLASWSWLNGGGMGAMRSIVADSAAVFTRAPQTTGQQADACGQARPALVRAVAFPPPPAEPLRTVWARLLTAWGAALDACVRAGREPPGGRAAARNRMAAWFEVAFKHLAEFVGLAQSVTEQTVAR